MTHVDTQLIAVAVVRRDDEVLIGRRPSGVPLAGYWEFPGGKVKPGEQPADAAVRECREEAGVHVRVVEELPSTTHAYEHADLDLRFFACTPQAASATPQQPFRWTPIQSLASYRFPAANAKLIAHLLSSRFDR